MKPAVLMTWTESERGWGQRPDGASLHLSQEDVREYIRAYWEREKARNPSGDVPDEYSRPDGTQGRLVMVDDELHAQIKVSEHGIMLWQGEYSKMRSERRIVEDLGTRADAEAAAEPEEDYVGIVERNDWEAEVFGYYWERTPEAERFLKAVADRYRSEGDTSIRLELATEQRLRELDDGDRNGYRRRVTVYEAPDDWAAFVEEIAPSGRRISDDDVHPFYKGRGLPDEMKREWRGR